MKDFLFGWTVHDKATDVGLLLVRLVAGLSLAFLHGIGKVPPQEGFVGMLGGMGLPAPGLFAWLAALAEFGGGLLLAVGLLTRPVAFVVTVHFIIVVTMVHAGDPIGDRELPLLFLVTAVLLLLAGPGRYSVDGALAGRRGHSA